MGKPVNALVMYGSIIIAGIYLGLNTEAEGVREHYLSRGEDFKLSVLVRPILWSVFPCLSFSVRQPAGDGVFRPFARDEQVIRRFLWIAAPINGLFEVFPVLCGLSGHHSEFAQLSETRRSDNDRTVAHLAYRAASGGFLVCCDLAMSARGSPTIFTMILCGKHQEGFVQEESYQA